MKGSLWVFVAPHGPRQEGSSDRRSFCARSLGIWAASSSECRRGVKPRLGDGREYRMEGNDKSIVLGCNVEWRIWTVNAGGQVAARLRM